MYSLFWSLETDLQHVYDLYRPIFTPSLRKRRVTCSALKAYLLARRCTIWFCCFVVVCNVPLFFLPFSCVEHLTFTLGTTDLLRVDQTLKTKTNRPRHISTIYDTYHHHNWRGKQNTGQTTTERHSYYVQSFLVLIVYMMFHLNESKLDVSALNTKVLWKYFAIICLSKILEVVTLSSFLRLNCQFKEENGNY